MNSMIRIVIVLLASTTFTSMATAAASPSVEQGKQLFGSAALGTNNKSYATCHPAGKGLEDAVSSTDKELEAITNKCVEKALKGKALAGGSQDLSSLILYLKSVGQAKGR